MYYEERPKLDISKTNYDIYVTYNLENQSFGIELLDSLSKLHNKCLSKSTFYKPR